MSDPLSVKKAWTDYATITAVRRTAHLPVLRRFLPYHHGVQGDRWLNILMNRIDPHLFAQTFTSSIRATRAVIRSFTFACMTSAARRSGRSSPHSGVGLGDNIDVIRTDAPGAAVEEPFSMEADRELRTLNQVRGWLGASRPG